MKTLIFTVILFALSYNISGACKIKILDKSVANRF